MQIRSKRSPAISTSFKATRISKTTFLIVEHDRYGEFPFIYAKQHPTQHVLILSDTGTGRPKDQSMTVSQLKEFIETYPTPELDGEPINPLIKDVDGNVEPERKYIVICSHCHYDHIGGIEAFANLDTTSVVASGYEKDFLLKDLDEHSECKYLEPPMPVPKYEVDYWAQHGDTLCLLSPSYDCLVENPHPVATPGTVQPPDQRPEVNEAVSYVEEVKEHFTQSPEVYRTFLSSLKDYSDSRADLPSVIRKVIKLFINDPQLIVGFNTWLAPGYKIEYRTGSRPRAIRITTPTDITDLQLPWCEEVHIATKDPLGITFILTPGHTPDSLAWYDQDEMTLYTGDTFYERFSEETKADMPIIFPKEGNLLTYFASLKRMLLFVRTENLKAGKASGAEGGESDTILLPRRVKVAAAHQTYGRDAEESITEVLALFTKIVNKEVPVLYTEEVRGEQYSFWMEGYKAKYTVFMADRIVEEARKEKGELFRDVVKLLGQ